RDKLKSPKTKPAETKAIKLKFSDEEYTKLKKAWDNYRFNAITSLVKKIHDKVKAIKPGVMIGASADGWIFPDPSYQRFQNWKTGLEKGYIDYVQTMTYSTFAWPQRWPPRSTMKAARRQANGLGTMRNRLIVIVANYGRSQYDHNFGKTATYSGHELLPEIKGMEDLDIGGYGLFTAYHLTEDQIRALGSMSYDYKMELPEELKRTPGKKNILFDNAHALSGWFDSNCSKLFGIFNAKGIAKPNNVFPLNEELLENVDVAVTFPIKPFSYDEAAALEKFIKRGGSLVVIGGDYQAQVLKNNFFLERFGIKFKKAKGMQASPLLKHPVTKEVNTVSIGSPSGELEVTAPAKSLMGKDDKVGVAIYEGKGKIVVIADEGLLGDKGIDRPDHRRFFENLVDWIVK
ncbi:DUF4350 domain-containing protein, partial [Verrucomicrobiota bacterium]